MYSSSKSALAFLAATILQFTTPAAAASTCAPPGQAYQNYCCSGTLVLPSPSGSPVPSGSPIFPSSASTAIIPGGPVNTDTGSISYASTFTHFMPIPTSAFIPLSSAATAAPPNEGSAVPPAARDNYEPIRGSSVEILPSTVLASGVTCFGSVMTMSGESGSATSPSITTTATSSSETGALSGVSQTTAPAATTTGTDQGASSSSDASAGTASASPSGSATSSVSAGGAVAGGEFQGTLVAWGMSFLAVLAAVGL